MFRRDTVQLCNALLILVTLGVRLHAQSPLELSSWIPQSHANHYPGQSFVPGTLELDLDPDARPTDTTEIAQPVAFVGNTLPNDFGLYCSACCSQSTYSRNRTTPQQQIPDFDHNPRKIENKNDHDVGAAKSGSTPVVQPNHQPELDPGVYYRNKLEFAFDSGYLPINIPFVFDVFLGDAYTRAPLDYTLVPLVFSLRWHIDDVGGPWIFRGNWDMTVSGSITVIPRGPETHYFSYDMGIRRNFVPRRGKIAPYFDGRLGLGRIDAKEPLGLQFAQGQNFTFTVNMGAGARYNFNSRYSLSAGLNWMHISNLYLSEPAFSNYGINVYGPMFGINIRVSKPRNASK